MVLKREKGSYNIEYGILSSIGILCVVMGHVGCEILSIDGWLPYASFHMPLFFFISGCFYKREAEKVPFPISAMRLVKKLLIPFYIIYLFYWFCYLGLNKWFHCGIGMGVSFRDYIMSPFLNVQPVGFCAPAWFVLTLFGVRMLHLTLQKWLCYLKRTESDKCLWTMIIYIIAGTLAFEVGDQITTGLGKNLLKIILGLSFYQIGYIFHNYCEEKVNSIHPFVYFGFLIILREILWIRTGWASIAMYSFSDIEEGYFVIVFSAMTGILLWYKIAHGLSHIVRENGLMIYISKHTFSIMINHLFVIFLIHGFIWVIQKATGNTVFDIETYRSQVYFVFSKNPIVLIVLSLLSIYIIIGIQKIIDKLSERVRLYEEKRD